MAEAVKSYPPNDDRTPADCYAVLRRSGVVGQFVAPSADASYTSAVRELARADGFEVRSKLLVPVKGRPAHRRTGRKWVRLFRLVDKRGEVVMPDGE